MRILMTTDAVGGVWTYSVELARALEAHGVEVALATMGPQPSSEQRDELREIESVTIHTSEFKLEWMEDPWEDVRRAGEWLLRLERQIEPDLIHLNGYCHGGLPWKAPVLVAGHSCVVSWWHAVKHEPAPASWDHYRAEVSRGLHAADLVLAPTRAMLSALEANYGSLHRARVVHNCRTTGIFQPGTKEPFVFAAGRVWDEAKNTSALESIAGELEWPIYLAGADSLSEGRASRATNICPLGRLAPQALPFWYARASIYALPARYEPFGLSALEAALAGCALILGDIDSLREVWGDAALFIPPDDHQALRSAISMLISDDDLRERMALAARTRALQYTPQRMAHNYLDACGTALGLQEPALHDSVTEN